MDTTVETFEHAGLTCEIHWEEDASFCDPREWENFGTMVCWHPDYYLGDYQITNEDGRGAVKNRFHRDDFDSLEKFARYLTLAECAVCVLPLAVYEHSGITMFVGTRGGYPFDSAGWDTSTVGFIYATKEDKDRCGLDDKDVGQLLREEVKTYASWLEGEVYWWCVRDDEGEMMESCGGYVGDIDFVRQEAKVTAEALAKDIAINTEPSFPEGMRT